MDFGLSTSRRVEEHTSDTGRLVAWEVVPRIFVSQTWGRMQVGHAEAWVRMGDRMIASGQPFAAIHDWTQMEAYDSATRRMLQEWSLRNRSSFTEVHIAIRSKLVRMGVAVANLALGDLMQTHDDSESLAEAFEATLAKHRAEGLFPRAP